ncbi:MAG: CRISPR-associated endonuclease Cas2 [Spirochaetales bacterium]|nr:CRISPR-associated endonuclease Cas2 [Spirochaetales bacterium]
MLIWVIYDITSDKSRNKIAKVCKEHGLFRVQYSVFLGDMPPDCMDEIAEFSRDLIDLETDGVFIIPVSEDDFGKKKIIGKSFNEDLITGKKNTLML